MTPLHGGVRWSVDKPCGKLPPLTVRRNWRMDDLLMAALSGDEKRVGQLLAGGADANHTDGNGWTALMRAAEGGHITIADRLLAAKAKVDHADNKGKTALMRAAENRRVAMVDQLIKYGANVNH